MAYVAHGSDVDTVPVDGKMLMRHRLLTTIDEKQVFSRVRERVVRLLEAARSARR